MRTMLGGAILLLIGTMQPVVAEDRAGAFDYYVLALSWTPSWCEREGDARQAAVCRAEEDRGFVLHGLWPQHREGWPEYCPTTARDPSRGESNRMADIMGSGGLAWYQWKKHGRCSGLSSRDYFALSREAFGRVERPAILRQVDEPLRLDPDVVEAAFLEANPWLGPESVTVTCRDGRIQEVRICLSRTLAPVPCTGSAARACTGSALFPPVR